MPRADITVSVAISALARHFPVELPLPLGAFDLQSRLPLLVTFEFQGAAVKSIQVDSDVYAYLKAHGMALGQSASDVLRQTLFHAIEIDDDVFADLMSLASGAGETANAILRRALDVHTNPAPGTHPRSSHRASTFIFWLGQEQDLECPEPRSDGGRRTDFANL